MHKRSFQVIYKRPFLHCLILLCHHVNGISCKYIDGKLETSDNWAFLARFCFLSEEGQFEFYVEYDEDQGEPNLLLYYDADDQWPAVYKVSKSCVDKESVLKLEQNQVINLTVRHQQLKEQSGCAFSTSVSTTPKTKYTISVPTLPRKNHNVTKLTTVDNEPLGPTMEIGTETYTNDPNFDFENIDDDNVTDTDEAATKVPIRKRAVPTKLPKRNTHLNQGRTIACHNARRFRSSRERWWFVAISNCNGTKGINVKYKILMTNGLPGDYWHEQFSADEFYILPVLMAFSIAYSFLILAIVICSIELKSRQLLHSTYKLFLLSVFVQFFGILLVSMAFLKYAVNGIGSPGVRTTGRIFMGCSEGCFLLLLLLLAKGYTVTRGRLSLTTSVKITVFMCAYSITYVALFVYEAKVFDPGEILYLYESPAGLGLIILRICAWVVFIYSTVVTLKRYPEKGNFYYPFNICGTLWFVAGPAFILSANSYIDKWVRESIVCAVLLFIAFSGHFMFLLLTMPSVANKNFPYHVRTTQIGVMELTGTSGASTMEHFSHHAYEPTGNVEQTVIIPLTRRTEEIFGGIYSQRLRTSSFRVNRNAQPERPDLDGHDAAMENVLNWSVARNVSVLEIGRFDHVRPIALNGIDSQGNLGEWSGQGSARQSPRNDLNDWVKEVPLELFTVSGVVSTKRKNEEDLVCDK